MQFLVWFATSPASCSCHPSKLLTLAAQWMNPLTGFRSPASSSLQIMLYDNPQLVSTYLAAFQITGDRQYAGEWTVCLIAWDICGVSTACLPGRAGMLLDWLCAHVACRPCGGIAWQVPAEGEGGQLPLVLPAHLLFYPMTPDHCYPAPQLWHGVCWTT